MDKHIKWLAVMAVCAATPWAAAQDITRGAPQAYVANTKAAVVEQFMLQSGPALRLSAPEVPTALATLKRNNQDANNEQKALQIGYSRPLAENERAIALNQLAWQTLSDGSRVARVEIEASNAAGLRIGYQLTGPENGIQLRFAGDQRDQVFLQENTDSNQKLTWSPVLEGTKGTVELRVLPGFEPTQYQFSVNNVSHLQIAGSELNRKDSSGIGRSDACNIDIACVSNPSTALIAAASAVAKMVYTESSNGKSYVCTGTLLNSNPQSNIPYFYTASHCIDDQATASTLNTYWFFDAISCNSTAIPPYQLITGGAQLLVTDPTMDVSLLRLNQNPPNGAVLAAWDASVIPTNADIIGLHHPSGDLKKYSAGKMTNYGQGSQDPSYFAYQRDSFIYVKWTNGTTEGGSSGSGLFTYNSNGYYTLRGGLEGGNAACLSPTSSQNNGGYDRYSRMDLLFTKLAPYLQPSAVIPTSNNAVATMVEFYNPQLDYYFMSSRENEKSLLDNLRDSKTNPMWYRTGYWFKTDAVPSASLSSLSRYFMPGAARASSRGTHFYTALNSDKQWITNSGLERFSSVGCSDVPNKYWCNEGVDSYIGLPYDVSTTNPDSAKCYSGEVPIYRVFRGEPRYADDGNHRYLTNSGMYAYMVNDQGWNKEGINLCAKP